MLKSCQRGGEWTGSDGRIPVEECRDSTGHAGLQGVTGARGS
jgi:hypothetical protein